MTAVPLRKNQMKMMTVMLLLGAGVVLLGAGVMLLGAGVMLVGASFLMQTSLALTQTVRLCRTASSSSCHLRAVVHIPASSSSHSALPMLAGSSPNPKTKSGRVQSLKALDNTKAQGISTRTK